MSLSELEALTIVWEASDVSHGTQNQFWNDMEEIAKTKEITSINPHELNLQGSAYVVEEWIQAVIKSATKVQRQLEVRLFKLKRTHEEVEKLHSSQDAKSKIISLDSEKRIISAQLSEFEEKANIRMKKKISNSANFLKEERFRKQIQAKFVSKLESLGCLLQDWKKSEGSIFQSNEEIDQEYICVVVSVSNATITTITTKFRNKHNQRVKFQFLLS